MRVAGLAVAAGLLVAAVGAVGAIRAARRLDRLHVRTDASWAALDAALCHRARVVSALDDALNGALNGGSALRCAAHVALSAREPAVLGGAGADLALRARVQVEREEVENELGRVLAVLDRTELGSARAARLADAEQRVVIARRVYNDAVRDTLALRSHRRVRWLRLAGRAPLPRYFEIAEPALPG
ncbi:MAG: NUDIX hydrolase [Pseudonocardiaceae bacterium]